MPAIRIGFETSLRLSAQELGVPIAPRGVLGIGGGNLGIKPNIQQGRWRKVH